LPARGEKSATDRILKEKGREGGGRKEGLKCPSTAHWINKSDKYTQWNVIQP
jgi:hypothetical protein